MKVRVSVRVRVRVSVHGTRHARTPPMERKHHARQQSWTKQPKIAQNCRCARSFPSLEAHHVQDKARCPPWLRLHLSPRHAWPLNAASSIDLLVTGVLIYRGSETRHKEHGGARDAPPQGCE